MALITNQRAHNGINESSSLSVRTILDRTARFEHKPDRFECNSVMHPITFTRYASRSQVKKTILKHGLLPYKCSCGNTGEWNGKPLTLQLDHINGDRYDHRLENLRFLCPNCHTQEPTSSKRKNCDQILSLKDQIVALAKEGKNIRTILISLGQHEGSGMYAAVRRLLYLHGIEVPSYDRSRSVERPTKEQLAIDLEEYPLAQLAKKHGVSITALRRWCEVFGLTLKPQGFWNRKDTRKIASGETVRRKMRRKIDWPPRDKLEQEIWETPPSRLTTRYGVSDVAIARHCKNLGIKTPPRGYWNRRKAGQTHEEALQPIPPKTQQRPTVTEDQVRAIRIALAEDKESYRRIGRRIGCHHTAVSAIHKGQRFAHVI